MAIKQKGDFILLIKNSINLILLMTAVFQFAIFFEIQNIFGVLIIIFSWLLYTNTLFNFNTFYKFPISSFLIFGFVISQYITPLLLSTLEFKNLNFNLRVPFDVFTHSLLSLIFLILSHLSYSKFRKFEVNTRLSIALKKNHLFKEPRNYQLWVMGYIGLSSLFFINFYLPSQGSQAEGLIQKFIQGLKFFTYAPYFIIINNFLNNTKSSKFTIYHYCFFTILLLMISVGANGRGALVYGFAGLGFTLILLAILDIFKFELVSFKTIGLGLIIIYLFVGPLSDLATAMVIVRSQRDDITRLELLKKTFEVYNNKDLINSTNKLELIGENYDSFEWDERYLENRFASRFSNLKFNDNSLYLSNKISPYNSILRQLEFDKIVTVFPLPFLQLFEIDIDKNEVENKSRGDMIFYLSGAPSTALGGERVGHFSGIGMASFGWFYLPILYLLFIPLFYLLDSFSIKAKNGIIYISFLILINMKFVFMYMPSESIISNINYFIRGWAESILLYLILFKITSNKLFDIKFLK